MAPHVNDSKKSTKSLNDEVLEKLKLTSEKEKKRIEKENKRRRELEKAKNESYVAQASLLNKGQKTAKKQTSQQNPNFKQTNYENTTGAIAKTSNKVESDEIWGESSDNKSDNGWYSSVQQNQWTSNNSKQNSRQRSNSHEAAWKTEKQFDAQRGNSRSRYSSVSEASSWNLNEEHFPALGEAPIPKVNVWDKRKTKFEEIKTLEPQNKFDEEIMLHQALQLSMMEADLEKERQKKLEEEYKLQEELLKLNPTLIEDFEASEIEDFGTSEIEEPEFPDKEVPYKEEMPKDKTTDDDDFFQCSSLFPTKNITKQGKAFISGDTDNKIGKIIDSFGGWGLKENKILLQSEKMSDFLDDVIDKESVNNVEKNDLESYYDAKNKETFASNSESWDSDYTLSNEKGIFAEVERASSDFEEKRKAFHSENVSDSNTQNRKSCASNSLHGISDKETVTKNIYKNLVDQCSNHQNNIKHNSGNYKENKLIDTDIWVSSTVNACALSPWDDPPDKKETPPSIDKHSNCKSSKENFTNSQKNEFNDICVSYPIKSVNSFPIDSRDSLTSKNENVANIKISNYSNNAVQANDMFPPPIENVQKSESYAAIKKDFISSNDQTLVIGNPVFESIKSSDQPVMSKESDYPKSQTFSNSNEILAPVEKAVDVFGTLDDSVKNNYEPIPSTLSVSDESSDYIKPPTMPISSAWENTPLSSTASADIPNGDESDYAANLLSECTAENPLSSNPFPPNNILPPMQGLPLNPQIPVQFPIFNPLQPFMPNPAVLGGPISPMFGFPMDPLMMRQMLMLSNPFFASQLLAMEQYYRSLGMPVDLISTQETIQQSQPGMMGFPMPPGQFPNVNGGIPDNPVQNSIPSDFSDNLSNIQSCQTNDSDDKSKKTSQPPGFNPNLDETHDFNPAELEEDEDWFKKYLPVDDDAPAIPPPQPPSFSVDNSDGLSSVSEQQSKISKTESIQNVSNASPNAPNNLHNYHENKPKLTAMEACITKVETSGWSDPEDDFSSSKNTTWGDNSGWDNDNLPARTVKSSANHDKKYRQPSRQPQFKK